MTSPSPTQSGCALDLGEVDVLGDIVDSVLEDEGYAWGPGERERAVAVAKRLRAAWNNAPREAREEFA